MDRYIVQQIPGLSLWIVRNTETNKVVGPRTYADKIVADIEADDMNFQLKFDTDPEFRAAYLASVAVSS